MTFGEETNNNLLSTATISVSTFAELKAALENAVDGILTKIIVTESFDLEETLKITSGKNIILTAENEMKIGKEDWTVENPSDYADDYDKQQEVIEDAREKGEKALEVTDISKNPLPNEDTSIVLSRGHQNTLIDILRGAILQIGDANSALILDSKNIETKIKTDGSFLDVKGKVTLENGILMNGNNTVKSAYTAPVKVKSGGEFIMNGGRITSNKEVDYGYNSPGRAGGVYITYNGYFEMNSGIIDNNQGPTGGVAVSDLYGLSNAPNDAKPAEFVMNGGLIANNKRVHRSDQTGTGGGVLAYVSSKFDFNNGIIAGNSSGTGGGISVIDNYVHEFDGVNYSKTNSMDYENYVLRNKAELNVNGGLIYKNEAYVSGNPNRSGAGGGIYVSSNYVNLNKGLLLDNKSENMGGGIYVSIVPYTQKLENILITENNAYSSNQIYYLPGGNGGGIWNCPIGDVVFEDYNSVYVFDNNASNSGNDLYLLYKNANYRVNGVNIGKDKYSTISPITKDGNIIKYLDDKGNIPERLNNYNGTISLNAIYNDVLRDEAWKNSKFFIIGNSSQKGGGIGSNANIIAPGNPKDNSLTIKKLWDERVGSSSIPENIIVDIFIGNAKYSEVILSKDNDWTVVLENLPFSKEELETKGLKYVIKEEYLDKFVSVVKENYKPGFEEKALTIGVERRFLDFDNWGESYDNPSRNPYKKHTLNVVLKDETGTVVEVLGRIVLNAENNWKGSLTNNFFYLNNLNLAEVVYYGQDDYSASGWEAYPGFSPYSAEYDINIVKNAEGTYVVEMPYLWIAKLSNQYENAGINITECEETILVHPPEHSFTITNYPYYNIPVEKYWDPSIEENDKPESIRVYLLNNGVRVKNEDGDFVYLDLTADNDWKGVFENVSPVGLESGEANYSLEEVAEGFKAEIGNRTNETVSLIIVRNMYAEGDLEIFKDYGYYSDKTINLYLNDELFASQIIPGHENEIIGTINVDEIPLALNMRALKIKYVLQENGKPYSRSLEEYDLRIVGNEVDGYTLLIPKLTSAGSAYELITAEVTNYGGTYTLMMTNIKEPPETPEEPPETPEEPPETPEEPPKTPEEPPETPEEPPEIPGEPPETPEEPPTTPEEPPVTLPELPEAPPEIPVEIEVPIVPSIPEAPPTPAKPARPGEAPKTFDLGIGIFGFVIMISLLSVVILERKLKRSK